MRSPHVFQGSNLPTAHAGQSPYCHFEAPEPYLLGMCLLGTTLQAHIHGLPERLQVYCWLPAQTISCNKHHVLQQMHSVDVFWYSSWLGQEAVSGNQNTSSNTYKATTMEVGVIVRSSSRRSRCSQPLCPVEKSITSDTSSTRCKPGQRSPGEGCELSVLRHGLAGDGGPAKEPLLRLDHHLAVSCCRAAQKPLIACISTHTWHFLPCFRYTSLASY
jgi:hypothetical protein